MDLLLIIFIICFGTYLIWKASELISVATDHLAYYYNVPSLVKGAIFVSLASSFPEFATVTLSTYFHHAFDLGVGTVVGSAVFNILLVPAFSQMAVKKPLVAHRDIIYKEGFFYVIAIAVTFLLFFYAVTFDSTDHLNGNITRGMALIPIALYIGYLYIQSREAKENGRDIDNFEPTLSKTKTWINLIIGCFFVFVVCEAKIIAVLALGDMFNVSRIFLGFTVCAFVTSVPDSFFSIRDALKGETDAALANAFGSNVFDLLICIPAGILIAGVATININEVILPMGFLIIATFLAIGVIRHNLKLTQNGSYMLLGIYAVFLTWKIIYFIG
jgi:cation:H+ antiporter